MICSECGSTLPDEAIFCSDCGSPITVAVKERKKIRIIPIAVVIFVTGVVALGLWGANQIRMNINESERYPKTNSLLIVQEEEGVLVYGESDQPIELDGALAYSSMSEDGSKACVVTNNDSEYMDFDLWYCDGKSAVKIEDGISNVWISPAGNKIAYIIQQDDTENYDLSLYDCADGITTDVCSEAGNIFVFSPDGKSYAYLGDQKLDEYGMRKSYVLYTSINEGVPESIGENLEPFGLSNDGKYLYYLDHGNDFTENVFFVQKDGEDNKLASNVSELGRLNKDCSQMLYYKNGATYISINGENGEKISNSEMRICFPPDTQYSNHIWQIDSFSDQFYVANSESGYSIGYIDSEFSENEIEDFTDYPRFDLSTDGESLAFVTDNGKIKYFSNYRNLEKDPIEIRPEEPVVDLIISSDKSVIYYEDTDLTLWAARGEDDPEDIADDMAGYLELSADGKGIFYISDYETPSSNDDCDIGGTLCFVSNQKGSKPTEVADEVYRFEVSKYGVTYMTVTDFDYDSYCYLADIYYSKNGKNENSFEQVSEDIQC